MKTPFLTFLFVSVFGLGSRVSLSSANTFLSVDVSSNTAQMTTVQLAALVDNFSDGNFTQNPTWSGNTDRFQVLNGVLQLNDAAPVATNTSYLSVAAPVSTTDSTTWEFLVRQDFAPSTSNYTQFYLQASTADLTLPLQGYFVRFGGISGNTDALELFRQDGSATTRLLSGTAGAVSTQPNVARVRVTRNQQGQWTLAADYTGGSTFTAEGSATDNTYKDGGFAGLVCRYTSTRNMAITLDDVRIDPLFTDTQAPALLSATATTPNSIQLSFSEPLGDGALQAVYQVSPGIGAPTSTSFVDGTRQAVELQVGTPLQNNTTYQVTTSNIPDAAGNRSGALSASFTFLNTRIPIPGDLVITEIMADPSPVVALPDAEFVEVYNRSNDFLRLGGVGISTGSTPKALPDSILAPGAYAIICDISQRNAFAAFGRVIALNGLPAISNSGDEIILTTADGEVLAAQSFTLSWYADAAKDDGGYTLEIIDPLKPGTCPANWRASQDVKGGTPGAASSLAGLTPDTEAPFWTTVATPDNQTIVLGFDEFLDAASVNNVSSYALSPSIAIVSAALQLPEGREVELVLAAPLQSKTLYTLDLKKGVKDCLGNAIDFDDSRELGLPEDPKKGDVLINEILFDPQSGGFDYVELYNASDKIIDLAGLQGWNTEKNTSTARITFERNYLLLPGEYVCLTESPSTQQGLFSTPPGAAFYATELPGLDADEGNFTLLKGSEVLDAFDYTEDYHTPLLAETKGVALERISPILDTQSARNWRSAAASVKYGTPGYANSQVLPVVTDSSNLVSLPKEVFSPDLDGFDDFLTIAYTAPAPGYLLQLRIFDAEGRPIRHLVNNELLASKGVITWDGSTEERTKAPVGVYVLWFEFFAPEGDIQRVKKTCVVAR